MKITSVQTFILRVPLGKERFYLLAVASPSVTVYCSVRVEAKDGFVGWGEGGQYGPPEPVAACIDHVLAPTSSGARRMKWGESGRRCTH